MHRTIRAALIVAAALVLHSSANGQLRVAPVGERPDRVTLELMLRKLASTGTFMQTDAHPDDEDNGLHHQASAKLTLEAFRAAGDRAKYPEQIKEGLRPWQAVRYFCTDETSFAPQPPPRTPDMLVADVSGFDADLGRTYADLGLEARSMHKCQGTSQLLLLPGQSQNRTYKLQDLASVQTGLNLGAPSPPPPFRSG